MEIEADVARLALRECIDSELISSTGGFGAIRVIDALPHWPISLRSPGAGLMGLVRTLHGFPSKSARKMRR
jgi:hypothetical protein